MQYKIQSPESISLTTIDLPTSKSISNRALIINSLAYSPYHIENLSDSDDTEVLLKVFNSNTNIFDIGAAGTSMRFLTAYLAKIVGEWQITGSERMKQRPIKILVEALRKLGAEIEYIEKEGFPPLKITGVALKGGDLDLAGDTSSQYISAILMIAPTIADGLKIHLKGNITSKPYIHLTLNLMEEFGVKSEWQGNVIHVPEQSYTPKPYKIEGDWSAASYWYEIIALSENGSIELNGLYKKSNQGDSKVAELFEQLGVKTEFCNNTTKLSKAPIAVSKFEYDFSDQPDLAQTFAATCCGLNIPFHFEGLKTLRIKESDRIYALIDELAKLGFKLSTNGTDTLSWNGETVDIPSDKPVTIQTYKDHRMAMAFAPLALKKFYLIIDDPMVITKSYPKYWNHLKKIGFNINQ